MISIALSNLRNNELLTLCLRTNEIISAVDADLLGFALYKDLFTSAYNVFKNGMEHQSVSTEEVAVADNQRDEMLKGLTNHLRNYRYHPDENKRQLARTILGNITKHGSRIYDDSYETETAKLTQIVTVIETGHSASLGEIAAEEWFELVKDSNANFEQTLRKYNGDKVLDENTLSATKARAELIDAIRKLFTFLPLQAEITQNAELIQMVGQLKVEAERF